MTPGGGTETGEQVMEREAGGEGSEGGVKKVKKKEADDGEKKGKENKSFFYRNKELEVGAKEGSPGSEGQQGRGPLIATAAVITTFTRVQRRLKRNNEALERSGRSEASPHQHTPPHRHEDSLNPKHNTISPDKLPHSRILKITQERDKR